MVKGEMIDGPKHRDIILGRSSAAKNHAGNVIFRSIIAKHKPYYSSRTKRGQKNEVTQSVIDSIKRAGGRFLSNEGAVWSIADDRKVFEKVNQALREGQSKQRLKGVAHPELATALPSENVYAEMEKELAEASSVSAPGPFPENVMSSSKRCLPDSIGSSPSNMKKQSSSKLSKRGLHRKGKVSKGVVYSRNEPEHTGTWEKNYMEMWNTARVKTETWEHDSLPTCTTATGTTFTGANSTSSASNPHFYEASQTISQQNAFPDGQQRFHNEAGMYQQGMTLLQYKQLQVRQLQSHLQMVDIQLQERNIQDHQRHLGLTETMSAYGSDQFHHYDGTVSTTSSHPLPGFSNLHVEPVMSNNIAPNQQIHRSNNSMISPGLQSLQNPQIVMGPESIQVNAFDQSTALEYETTTSHNQFGNGSVASTEQYHSTSGSLDNSKQPIDYLDNTLQTANNSNHLNLAVEASKGQSNFSKEQAFAFPSNENDDLSVPHKDIFDSAPDLPTDELSISRSLSFMSFSDSSQVSMRRTKSHDSFDVKCLDSKDCAEQLKHAFSSPDDHLYDSDHDRGRNLDPLSLLMKDMQNSFDSGDEHGDMSRPDLSSIMNLDEE